MVAHAELGIFHAVTDVHGNIMVSQDRIRYAYESGAGDPSAVLLTSSR